MFSIAAEIGLLEAVRIAKDAAQHAGPGLADDQMAALVGAGLLAFFRVDRGVNAGQGQGGRTGLERGGVGQRRDHDAAGLGLPPGIDDGQLRLADIEMVPHPGLGIDRLAHGAQEAQAGEVVTLGGLLAVAHQGADDGGRGVENIDLELLHDLPETVRPGIGGHALEHQGGGAEAQRTIEDIGVAGDPADIRGAPVDVVVLQVKDPLAGVHGIGQVAAGGMDHALGLAGGTGGVEDEQDVLGVHGFRRTVAGDIRSGNLLVPPGVAALLHRQSRCRPVGPRCSS